MQRMEEPLKAKGEVSCSKELKAGGKQALEVKPGGRASVAKEGA
jgi:hypothetical protein